MTVRRALPLALTAVLAAVATTPAHAAVSTLAGTVAGFAGDGGSAAEALLNGPAAVAVAPDGSLVIADTMNNRVRRVTSSGIISTAAGVGTPPTVPPGTDENTPAPSAALAAPADVALAGDGSTLIADTGTHRIRRITAGGLIQTVAGTVQGLGGDGGPASAALLNAPAGVAVAPDGGLLIADTGNSRIRRVAPDGTISTVAGTGPGFGGDGGAATAAMLNGPRAVAPLPGGGFLIADTGNDRVRLVDAAGIITTVAGLGVGFDAQGGPRAETAFATPGDVLPLPNGGVLVADTGSDRLRRITPLGAVVTVAGGRRSLGGDGGPTRGARFDSPAGLAAGPDGRVLIADTGNSRVRQITDLGALPDPEPLRTIGVEPLTGQVNVRPRGRGTQIALNEPDLAPNVSAVEATRGSVRLRVRPLDATTDSIADVGGSRFTLVQPAGEAAIADLRLTAPLTCGRAATRQAEQHQVRRRTVRRVRIKVRGRYRTSGRYATAVANGTAWTITDRCDRTIIRVTEGVVTVRDQRRNRTVRIRAGRSYVALARPAATPARRR